MTQATILVGAALAASLFLLVAKPVRAFAVGASIVCAIDLAMQLGILRTFFTRMDLVVAVAVAVAGGLLIFRTDAKVRVIAATVVAVVGVVQVLGLLL
jgi:hypothetical protein